MKKIIVAAALLMAANVAQCADGMALRMLNDNLNPSVGDRIALQELIGDCRFYGKVVPASGADLSIKINRKVCLGDVEKTPVDLVVPLPGGSAADLYAYPARS
ncbi:hypothetical protein [Pseudomonas fluorescens]|uniref:hypothetical protein n=1 Tax=Pseudomonas fluorescens TaxID=294 RepID=UPI001BEB2965|nr:hypothetical protein [Pseudomonas fluorescens]MBT2375526.1 hypothetical protein [Pseudomonas fluorescens]